MAPPGPDRAARQGVRAVFFLVSVRSEGPARIGALLDSGRLSARVGEVLPFGEARLAHEMLAGRPHKRGKIVLQAGR